MRNKSVVLLTNNGKTRRYLNLPIRLRMSVRPGKLTADPQILAHEQIRFLERQAFVSPTWQTRHHNSDPPRLQVHLALKGNVRWHRDSFFCMLCRKKHLWLMSRLKTTPFNHAPGASTIFSTVRNSKSAFGHKLNPMCTMQSLKWGP